MSIRRMLWVLVCGTVSACGLGLGSPVSAQYRSIDGTGNNLANPDWGAAHTELLRQGPAAYSDGISEMAGETRPSPRMVSNNIVSQAQPIANDESGSDWIWQWGQFLDHDLDLTDTGTTEVANIEVPAGDPQFDPFNSGTAVIAFTRSLFAAGSVPREQENILTAYIDASNVYGSDDARATELRTLSGGKLKTSAGLLLPFNVNGFPNAFPGGPPGSFFLAGDVRANEQAGLAAAHTLFVREHNRLCDEFALANPTWDDEQLYQEARRIVGAQMQVITYREFLPQLLGAGALAPYAGYDPAVNAGINNEFSTASYRFGHSMLSPQILRYSELGTPTAFGPLSLSGAFFNPDLLISQGGIDPILRGLASQVAQRVDNHIVSEVRNFLFGPPGSGGLDLASLNLQRGRDHGLPDLNSLRVSYGLAAHADFASVSSTPSVQAALAATYSSVNDIDPWIGGLCEDHVAGAMVGETLLTVLKDQFERLRDGDRFYYENQFSGAELAAIEATRLSDIIRRNTMINAISDNVFVVPDFGRGDCNQDGMLDVADAVSMITYLFSGQTVNIGCEDACDVNDDGAHDISDVIYPVNFLFQGGPQPPAPFGVCGSDPSYDTKGCYSYAGCP
ncbi:MAG: peroxidase family protein [Planctomycetota bacterium]